MYKQNMIKNLIRLKSYVSASQIINFWLLDIFCGSFSLLKKKKKKLLEHRLQYSDFPVKKEPWRISLAVSQVRAVIALWLQDSDLELGYTREMCYI